LRLKDVRPLRLKDVRREQRSQELFQIRTFARPDGLVSGNPEQGSILIAPPTASLHGKKPPSVSLFDIPRERIGFRFAGECRNLAASSGLA
jgi:hypothetical protein